MTTFEPGQLIGDKYRILRSLGSGGMGAVYEAENIRIERRVAIKVLHAATDPQHLARFEAEARAASRIGSRHITEVLDLDHLPSGQPYMVMEYLCGETLGERLERRGTLTVEETVPIACQILEALRAAHEAGIVHRDLKPDNVFLALVPESNSEIVKLLDFGISKFTSANSGGLSLTRTGFAIGTPHYMSPEQATGSKEIDIRTDLYSLGVILYRCFSGRLPYDADNYNALLVQILSRAPVPLQQLVPNLEPRAAAIVARAMERRPSERFQSAVEFQSTMSRLAVSEPVLVRPTTASTPETLAAAMGPTGSSWAATGLRRTTGRRTRLVALAAALVVVVGVVALVGGMRSSAGPENVTDPDSDPSVTKVVASPPVVAAPSIVTPKTIPLPAEEPPEDPTAAADAALPAQPSTSPSAFSSANKAPRARTSRGAGKRASRATQAAQQDPPVAPSPSAQGHEEKPAAPAPAPTRQGPARVIVRQL